jgi:hypothetical protein
MKADDGVAPVVAVALLIGLVAVAGAVIGLTMFAALEDAAGTLPDVRFQTSADGRSLYHAGGDVLPLKNLAFYDTSKKEKVTIQLVKSGNTEPENSLDGELWETGDKLQFAEDILKVLSIVGLDSRNRPALLYIGTDAVVLPVGDIVPDEWIVAPPEPTGPTPVPTPVPIGSDGRDFFHGQDRFFLQIGGTRHDLLVNFNIIEKLDIPSINGNTQVIFISQNANNIYRFSIRLFTENWEEIPFDNNESGDINKDEGRVEIPPAIIENNPVKYMYVTIEVAEKIAM